jgi:4-diphosphocytidyl-2-C-methyl-D-erythritol kinase
MKIKTNSYAKINLTFDILGRFDDEYHEVNSLIQLINLHDELFFEEDDEVNVICSEIPSKQNLVYKTVMLLRDKYSISQGIRITINKNIPIGAGLGGGSSNAAITLLILNKMWDLNLNQDYLNELAEQIGMDVNFFIYGGTCLVSGRGEEVMKIDSSPSLELLLVYPNFRIDSKQAYSSLDYNLVGKKQSSTCLLNDLEQGIFDISLLHNDFEYSIFKQYPVLRIIKEQLLSYGATNALLSGSGSVVYGVFDDISKLENAIGLFPNYITIKTSTRSPNLL